ncbi:MAG: hypothetical protein AAF724_20850 [Pseudomonadota bacterium]
MSAANQNGASASKEQSRKKQAVVVIHGMGEQFPMDTLRGFVDAVWVTDEKLISKARQDPNTGQQRVDNPVWDKPDRRNRSYELRRITTEKAKNGVRTDFYEFYWAHLMHGTSWEHLKCWFADLLLRSPKRVPNNVFAAWVVLWIITLTAVVVFLAVILSLGALMQVPTDPRNISLFNWRLLVPIVLAVLSITALVFLNRFLIQYFGDVARYVKASPPNVARRQEIREKGVELLETLMGVRDVEPVRHGKETTCPKWDTQYDRIIVVSHSLGTIVAYDILRASFARINRYQNQAGQGRKKQPRRHELEKLLQEAFEKSGSMDVAQYRRLQRAAWQELKDEGNPWLVSDFITLGSPLTHAEFLLVHDEEDLRTQQEKRTLPTCPPTLEWDQKTKHQHFTYASGGGSSSGEFFRVPHHAAHFAFTRWTNIYSTSKNILWGDILSGPVGELFGLSTPVAKLHGILDIPVLPEQDFEKQPKDPIPFFTHTKYWDLGLRTSANDSWAAPYHIHKLREAINLLDE